MSRPESGGGPSPEDIDPIGPEPAVPGSENNPPPANEAPTPGETPLPTEEAEKPGILDRVREKLGQFGERRRNNKEQAEIQRNISQARERQIKRYVEIIKHGASSPQELQEAMANISFKELRDAEQRAKFGAGGVGKLRAFLAGERDFEVTDEGTIEDANILKEAGRRLITTFGNRRTAVSAGVYLAMGALTGGLGWAAGGVLFGGVAGRGAAEMGELFAGKTREARESVLFAERARWERMQALAIEISQAEEDPARKGDLAHQLVDLLYRQGDSVLMRDLAASEKELSNREEKFNRIRNRMQTAGELVGAAAGITSILNGGVEHIDMDFFGKVDGQSIFHGVQQTQQGWQFLYSSGAEAATASMNGATILAGGQFGAHALEATTSQVVAYTIAERTLPMLLASGLAWASERKSTTAPDKYWQKSPDGSRVYYTRNENGTYQYWEKQEVESGEGKDKKKETKWVAKDVPETEVPSAFRNKFTDFATESRARKAERLHGQIGSAAEYIRGVADQNNNPIPESPRGYEYNWNEQPATIDVPDIKPDLWYLRQQIDGKDFPAVDPVSGKIVEVAVLGVDVSNNRIVYARFEQVSNGAKHVPVEVNRLDHFLERFRLHLDPKSGSGFSTEAPAPNTDTPPQDGVATESNPRPDLPEPSDPTDPSPTPPPPTPAPPSPEPPISPNPEPKVRLTQEELDKGIEEFDQVNIGPILEANDGTPTAPVPPVPEPRPEPGPPQNKEKKVRKETLRLPDGYEKFSPRQIFDWLADIIPGLSPEVQQSLGVAHFGDQEKDIIRYVDKGGFEHIITLHPTDAGGWRFDLFKKSQSGYYQKDTLSVPSGAAKWQISQVARDLLWNINDVIRNGPRELEEPVEQAGEDELEIDPQEIEEPVPINTPRNNRRQQPKNRVTVESDEGRLMPGFKRDKENGEDDFDNKVDASIGGDDTPIAEPVAEQVVEPDRLNVSIGDRLPGLANIRTVDGNAKPSEKPEASEITPDPTSEIIPDPIAESTSQDTDLARLGLSEVSDLIGKEVQLDDISVISMTEDVPTGEFDMDSLTPESRFTIEEVGGDMLRVSFDGASVLVNQETILPHITEVFSKQ